MCMAAARMSESCKHSVVENYPKMSTQKMNEVKSTLLRNSLLLASSVMGRSVGFLESLMWPNYKNIPLIPESRCWSKGRP